MKVLQHASVNLGSACKWPSYSARWVAMDTMQFYVIQIGLFSGTIRIFGILWSHWTISHPWIIVLECKVSRISPLRLSRCVCVGGGIVFHDFTSIFTFMNTHEYANDIILLYDLWMKGLVILYRWWYNNMQQGEFGGRIQFIFPVFFLQFPLFSEIFINIDEYAN